MDSIVEKLRKLLAHERSARAIGSIAEAEAFAVKIQELLTSHKLDMTDVEIDEREQAEDIDWEVTRASEAGFSDVKSPVRWQYKLAQAIAKCNTCRAIASQGNSVRFAGRTSDRQVCKMLFVYMLELARDMADNALADAHKIESLKEYPYKRYGQYSTPNQGAWSRDYKKSWYSGFSEAVVARFNERYEAMLAAAQTTVAQNAIVRINRDVEKVKDFLRGKTSGFSFGGGLGRNQSAYDAGKQSGAAVALTPYRVSQPAGGRLMLGGGK